MTKQIVSNKMITYRWWNSDSDAEIISKHIPLLEANAHLTISEKVEKGYQCGELNFSFTDEKDNQTIYRGYWEVKEVPEEKHPFTDSELTDLLECARLALNDASTFDDITETCDLSDEYMSNLRDKLQEYMNAQCT